MTLSRIREAFEQYRQDVKASAKACVEEGGGIWVGIQEMPGALNDLVLFNSPTTGSTLALKTTEITPELVKLKIKRSDAAFKAAGRGQ
jgi:hypothetical protein